MDKVSDTPRTDAFISKFYKSRPLSSGSRHRTDVELHDFSRQLERELAAQKEHYRVLEEEMLVLNTMRHEALKDAVENMEIAQEFKKLMEQYRQREAEANKALRVAAGLLSTMPQFSNMHLDDVLEKILEETREKK